MGILYDFQNDERIFRVVNKIICGDSLEVLKTLESESVDCVVTSPPYWALRDYGTGTWEGGDKKCDHSRRTSKKVGAVSTESMPTNSNHEKEGWLGGVCGKCGAVKIDKQLGLEPTFQEYITKLCDVFDEVKRVLKKSGTCWVNMGDTYGGANSRASSGGRAGYGEPREGVYARGQEKSLTQIPFRFSIEMCNRGWILRNTIIWHKPNCMPTSAKDRFTVDFEYVFFFVKNKKYWFEQQLEPHKLSSIKSRNAKLNQTTDIGASRSAVNVQLGDRSRGNRFIPEGGRNKRTVWKITTKPYKEAHFAVFPEELVETPIKAGCPKGGIVLDIFSGSGTTAAVAKRLGRKYLGIELNPEYIKLALKRIANTMKSMF